MGAAVADGGTDWARAQVTVDAAGDVGVRQRGTAAAGWLWTEDLASSLHCAL